MSSGFMRRRVEPEVPRRCPRTARAKPRVEGASSRALGVQPRCAKRASGWGISHPDGGTYTALKARSIRQPGATPRELRPPTHRALKGHNPRTPIARAGRATTPALPSRGQSRLASYPGRTPRVVHPASHCRSDRPRSPCLLGSFVPQTVRSKTHRTQKARCSPAPAAPAQQLRRMRSPWIVASPRGSAVCSLRRLRNTWPRRATVFTRAGSPSGFPLAPRSFSGHGRALFQAFFKARKST